MRRRVIFAVVSTLMAALILAVALVNTDLRLSVQAQGENKAFIPFLLTFKSLGVPATPIPPPAATATATATATVTPTATATATATTTPTITPTPTITLTPTATSTAMPEIVQLEAAPDLILSGQDSTLSWEIVGEYDKAVIQPDVGDVTGDSQAVVSPTQTTEYTLKVTYGGGEVTDTVTVTVGESGQEIVAYLWDGSVPKSENGFPRFDTPNIPAYINNGDWTQPSNFAEGTFHFYAVVREMPVDQEMIIQNCYWQGLQLAEACAERIRIGVSDFGKAITWSEPVKEISHNNSKPNKIDWSQPRTRIAFAIKNSKGQPVSGAFDWSGEDPDEWYPLDWLVITVVVEKGKVFSGWEDYIPKDPTATPTATSTPTVTATSTATATPTATPTPET